jgi:phosphatidylinositol-3-phosphatase
MLENHEFDTIIDAPYMGSPAMPDFNAWASQYTLLTQYYGVTHPSLPNYIALIGGDTFGITSDCEDCFINATSLPDLIEASGRTWRTYQEALPQPCFSGSRIPYAQKHDPFIYFDPIRTNSTRCQEGIVPLTQLDSDLANKKLPDFTFIMPDLCHSAHDCSLQVTDNWLAKWVGKVMASPAYDARALIMLTWDEGQTSLGCCGFNPGGGRVATVLISPLVRRGLEDTTRYNHYSLLKKISASWGLKELGHAADEKTVIIEKPFEVQPANPG